MNKVVMDSIVSPPDSYVEALPPNYYEYDCILR